jgi:malonate decarboxylase beta subunit
MNQASIQGSFIERTARERAEALLDPGTFRELLDPFDRIESPHLALQNIVPQSDDGAVVARGMLEGQTSVVIAIEGKFQGGGIGEVSGAKIAGALEQALRDNEQGVPTRPVLVLETGGVRLQEGNYGLLAIAEIQAAIIALRQYLPVVCVIPGMIGCFGGMSITAGLCSTIIMTRQARLGLNGPEVIEQEAGILEFDSRDRPMIWGITSGEQRFETGMADVLEADDADGIRHAVLAAFRRGLPAKHRSSQVSRYLARISAVDALVPMEPLALRSLWGRGSEAEQHAARVATMPNSLGAAVGKLEAATETTMPAVGKPEAAMAINVPAVGKPETGGSQSGHVTPSRGRIWFNALKGNASDQGNGASSVLCADYQHGDQLIRYLAVVPDAHNRFHRARKGEVGLTEGWTLARYVNEAVEADRDGYKRTIVAIVDVPSQAYGYQEEMLGIHLACAAAVDAYASARLAGHPVIALIVGNAISGAFLAHGLQANRILAFNDPGVAVQVMSRESIARVTRSSLEELEALEQRTPAVAHDICSFATLGALHGMIEGINADVPTAMDVVSVQEKLFEIDLAVRASASDISHRLASDAAQVNRFASITVRERMQQQWG